MTIIAVVGMASEAALVGTRPGLVTVIGAGNADSLASKLEVAIGAGAGGIISTGICGALAPQLQVGEMVIGVSVCREGETVIHCDQAWANRLFRALKDGPKPLGFPVSFGNFVSTVTPVATVGQREAIRASTAADAVDQESWVAATAAKAHAIPFVAMRVVLDRYDFDLPPAALLPFTPSGGNDIEAILGSVMGNPFQIAALIRLMGWSEIAMGNLSVALATLGGDFAA